MCRALLFGLYLAIGASAQLDGVIDLHVHSDPDSMPRSIDAVSLAKLARERGMRGLVLKNHYEETGGLAWVVRQQVPGLEVFGGIALNRSVGGVNPAAVEYMVWVKGGFGRIVWMPTFDAENQVHASGESRPWVAVSRDGQLLPEVLQVLDLAAKHRLVLETGHSSAAECLLLVREALRRGISRIVVTHAMLAPVSMSVGQMKEAARLGAYIEFVYNGLTGPKPAFTLREYGAAIRAVGPEQAILASDLGQEGNPVPPDGLAAFFKSLRGEGFTAAEIDRMAKVNPGRVLGL